MKKPAITSMPIHELLASRWSGRAFDAAKPVDHDQIITLLEAARWAPSCYGDQPWRFLVWNKGADAEAWQQAFGCLAPGNQAWVKDAPLLLLTTADTLFNHNGQPNRWGQHDTGAAAENLCLQETIKVLKETALLHEGARPPARGRRSPPPSARRRMPRGRGT